jgi:hypothetical protein
MTVIERHAKKFVDYLVKLHNVSRYEARLMYFGDPDGCIPDKLLDSGSSGDLLVQITNKFYDYLDYMRSVLELERPDLVNAITVTVMPSFEDHTYYVVSTDLTHDGVVILQSSAKAWNFWFANGHEFNKSVTTDLEFMRSRLGVVGIKMRETS